MSIAINSNPGRDQLVASNGQTVFNYSFPIADETYLTVYQRGGAVTPDDSTQQLTLGADYAVTGVGEEAGGTIVLNVAATGGDIITIVATEPIDRLSVFDDLNPFTVALNQQLNELTIMVNQVYTYWNNITPHYNYDELISAPLDNFNTGVRPFKRILPMLPDGHVWVGRGEIGDDPDDIVTAFFGGAGTGNVISSGPGMRPSITRWTGTDFIITDSEVNLPAGSAITEPTAGTTEEVTGFGDDWAAFHWPAHVTGGRPAAPNNGDTYYDTTFQQFFGYQNGIWVPFSTGDGNSNLWTLVITQPGHTFVPGDLVYQKSDGDFELLAATTPVLSEIQGMVVDPAPTDPDEFLIQFGGIVETSTWTAVPPAWLTGMTPGSVFFASDTTPGDGTLTPPITTGMVNLPVFLSFSATGGVLRHSRGLIIGGQPPTSSPDPAPPNTVTVTITQTGHGFSVDDWLYALPYNVGASEVQYAKGDSSALVSSHVAGVVILVIDANTFVLQEGGYCTGVVNTANNAPGSAIASGAVFYLSNTVPGKLMSAPPVTVGHYSVRCFECEQLATDDPGTSIDAGYILDKRPIEVVGGGAAGAIIQLVYNQYTGNAVKANGTALDVLDTTITLSNAANSVLYSCSITYHASTAAKPVLVLQRNGVDIPGAKYTGASTNPGVWAGTGEISAYDTAYSAPIYYLDTPGSVGPHTYRLVLRSVSGSIYLNGSNTPFGNGISTVILQEVAP